MRDHSYHMRDIGHQILTEKFGPWFRFDNKLSYQQSYLSRARIVDSIPCLHNFHLDLVGLVFLAHLCRVWTDPTISTDV